MISVVAHETDGDDFSVFIVPSYWSFIVPARSAAAYMHCMPISCFFLLFQYVQ